MRDAAKALAVLAMILLAYAGGFLNSYIAHRLSQSQVVVQGPQGIPGAPGRDADPKAFWEEFRKSGYGMRINVLEGQQAELEKQLAAKCNQRLTELDAKVEKFCAITSTNRALVEDAWQRLHQHDDRLTKLEARPECKCEKSVIVRGKPYPCDPCERKR